MQKSLAVIEHLSASKMVTLVSSDRQCFRVDTSIAQQSQTVSRLLEVRSYSKDYTPFLNLSSFKALAANENEQVNDVPQIPLSNVSARTLEKFIAWCTDHQDNTAEACASCLFI